MSQTRIVNGVELDKAGRGRIYNSLLETVGNTPLVRVPRLTEAKTFRAICC